MKKKKIIKIAKSTTMFNTVNGIRQDVNYWSRYVDTDLKHYNLTKMLGGKDNVEISKWWTHHGYGGWVYEYRIKNIEVAKQALIKQGWDYTIYQDIYDHGCFIRREVLETTVENKEV